MSRGDDPAYPAPVDETATYCGMTIREAFAKAAMQGMLSSDVGTSAVAARAAADGLVPTELMALNAITMANDMLAELAKRKQGMTIWQWAVCGLVAEAILQRFTYEFGRDTDGTLVAALGRAGKGLVMFGWFAFLGYLWNL